MAANIKVRLSKKIYTMKTYF